MIILRLRADVADKDNKNCLIVLYIQLNSSYSVLNRSNFYIDKALANKGKGRNFGVDITLERYLSRGWYYILTGSLFNSRYCGGDGVWHNMSVNIKLTLQGGDRYSPTDLDATLAHPDQVVQHDDTRAYSKQCFHRKFLSRCFLLKNG